MSVEVQRKPCNRCQRDLPFESFYAHQTNRDGLQNICINCWRGENRRRYWSRKQRRWESLMRRTAGITQCRTEQEVLAALQQPRPFYAQLEEPTE